jgi:hypothetical protein
MMIYKLNFGVDDGYRYRRNFATGPSTTAFCHDAITTRFVSRRNHRCSLKLNGIAALGAPPFAWYWIQTGDVELGPLKSSLATCHR